MQGFDWMAFVGVILSFRKPQKYYPKSQNNDLTYVCEIIFITIIITVNNFYIALTFTLI